MDIFLIRTVLDLYFHKRLSKVAVFELQGFYRKIQRQNPLCSSDFGLPAHFSPVNDIFGPFEHFQTIV